MKILLTGCNGQVGFELQQTLAPLGDVHALTRAQCDLAVPGRVTEVLHEFSPDIVVNAAAYTAVDRAQSEPDLAHAVNATAVKEIGDYAARTGVLVVHYSTDYVFDGAKATPYTEADTPHPQSVYGASKLSGEEALRTSGASHLIFRTSWVFGAHGGNFAKTILRLAAVREELKVVADQIGAPTSAALIAQISAQALKRYQGKDALASGTYHLAASGVTTWHDYAQAVVRAAYNQGKPLKLREERVIPITTAQYPLPAPRPANSQLDTTKLRRALGMELPHWETGLIQVMQQIQ